MATYGATSDDKVVKLTILLFSVVFMDLSCAKSSFSRLLHVVNNIDFSVSHKIYVHKIVVMTYYGRNSWYLNGIHEYSTKA